MAAPRPAPKTPYPAFIMLDGASTPKPVAAAGAAGAAAAKDPPNPAKGAAGIKAEDAGAEAAAREPLYPVKGLKTEVVEAGANEEIVEGATEAIGAAFCNPL